MLTLSGVTNKSGVDFTVVEGAPLTSSFLLQTAASLTAEATDFQTATATIDGEDGFEILFVPMTGRAGIDWTNSPNSQGWVDAESVNGFADAFTNDEEFGSQKEM